MYEMFGECTPFEIRVENVNKNDFAQLLAAIQVEQNTKGGYELTQN